MIRRFHLRRLEDESGVSGTGIVAIGAQFPSGKCVMEWQTALSSVALYDSIETLEQIHGHGGKTLVEWAED